MAKGPGRRGGWNSSPKGRGDYSRGPGKGVIPNPPSKGGGCVVLILGAAGALLGAVEALRGVLNA